MGLSRKIFGVLSASGRRPVEGSLKSILVNLNAIFELH